MELESVRYNILVKSVEKPNFETTRVYSVSKCKISHVLLTNYNLYVDYGLYRYLLHNLYYSVNIKTHENVRRLTEDALEDEI